MKDCVFCKIVKGEIPTEFLYEDDEVVAFRDINPQAPIHILIIPKKHIQTIDDVGKEDIQLLGKMIFVAKKLARGFKTEKDGYKLVFRVKKHGGQEVDHIHLHLAGGGDVRSFG